MPETAPTVKRAMLLAAGLGTRLRPLTYTTPKPLLPLSGDKTIIDHNLELLKSGGITDVIINLHHLGDQIRTHVGDGSKYGLRVAYSDEPEILGTGGGVKKASEFFQGEPFVVMNGDILIDIDIKDLIRVHLSKDCLATMVVRKSEAGEEFTPINVEDGRVESIGLKGSYMFTGLQVINPLFLTLLPPVGFSCIVQKGYIPALRNGHVINAYEQTGYWTDIGTIERYEEAKKHYPPLRHGAI